MASDTLGTGLICMFRFGSISICPYRRRCLKQRRGIKTGRRDGRRARKSYEGELLVVELGHR